MNDRLSDDLDALLDRQKEAWVAGDRPRAEELLTGSSFPGDSEALLDLLYNEIVLREELGELPRAEEYVRRYPHLAEDLRLHFEVHAVLHTSLLSHARGVRDAHQAPADSHDVPALPDYEVIAPLGRGGMGVVYKARQRRLNRLVALKMFQPGRVPSPRELDRFHTEAEAIARLQHPNIVQIFEVGESKGRPFLVLELADGDTLARRLQNLLLAPREAAELIKTLALAVRHAHSRQIIHRDLKPANVLFTGDGTPKITDFGLAKVLEESDDSPRDATRTGEPMGTPRYMVPEQAAGRSDLVGPATDIYALGALLYECVTGRAPFVVPGAAATMEKIRTEEPMSPRKLQPGVPPDLETICLKCLHKRPGRRYAGAGELADDLRRFLQGEPIRARPTPAWERLWMWARRRPSRAVLAAAAVLTVCAGVVAYGVNQRLEERRVAKLRDDLAGLLRDGRDALDRDDNQAAQERFLSALTMVRAEPALRDQELGVAGWLDHSRRQAEQERWSRRQPPPLFDDLRDEALVLCFLLPAPQKNAAADAREAIQAALSLTVADAPVWRLEREQLTLLEADLDLREGNAADALALLDRSGGGRIPPLARPEGRLPRPPRPESRGRPDAPAGGPALPGGFARTVPERGGPVLPKGLGGGRRRLRPPAGAGAGPFHEPAVSGGLFPAPEAPRGGPRGPDRVPGPAPALRLDPSASRPGRSAIERPRRRPGGLPAGPGDGSAGRGAPRPAREPRIRPPPARGVGRRPRRLRRGPGVAARRAGGAGGARIGLARTGRV